jgi:ABC-2 type transport system ATP-binding protein
MKSSIGLDGLDLEIEEGEIYGLLGPNGAGKTTTLKIITALLRPSRGEVKLFEKLEPREARNRVGFLPENPSFYPHLTGVELLRFYARLYKRNLSGKEAEEKLAMVGLENSVNKRIGAYSKGMIQRIGFAQALLGDPDFVVLDEPLSGLDPLGRREIKDLIAEVNRKGKTVLFSSHILSDLEAICSRVGIIFSGKMKQVGAISDILGRDMRYIEIEFEGIKEPGKFKKYGEIKIEADTNFLRVNSEETKDRVVKEIINKGGRVISIVPVKRTLEEHFIKAINE